MHAAGEELVAPHSARTVALDFTHHALLTLDYKRLFGPRHR